MSDFYERYLYLCARHHKTPSAVANEIGLSSAAATGWKRGKDPSEVTIIKLSQYFDVSPSYLTGKPKNKENAVEIVKDICKSRNIPIYRLEKDLGFANGYISQLRKGSIPYDRAVAIASYLNVPVGSILDGNKEDPVTFRDEVKRAASNYDLLNDENRAIIDQMIEKLIKSQSGE